MERMLSMHFSTCVYYFCQPDSVSGGIITLNDNSAPLFLTGMYKVSIAKRNGVVVAIKVSVIKCESIWCSCFCGEVY